MKNNFVAKNDFNRASTHRDRKNDYSRKDKIELDDELSDFNFESREEKYNSDFVSVLYLLSNTISQEEYRRVDNVFIDIL